MNPPRPSLPLSLLVALVLGAPPGTLGGAVLPPSGHAPDAPRRVEVLFLGHASAHHNSRELAPLLARALAERRISVSYTEDLDDLNPANLARYDVVALYANHASGTPEQVGALVDFVEAGGGMVPIHAGGGCFKNSEAYARLVSSRFLSHGTGTFVADVLAPGHPVMEGVEPFATWDETYVHEHLHDDRTVLMERVDPAGREPWTWARTQGEGRVVYTAYGHDRRTWEQPMFQRLVGNAVLWAAGDEVRAAVEAADIPPIEYSDASPTLDIPGYVPPEGAERLQVPLSPEESLKHYRTLPGFELELFAAEPEIVNLIAMAWDERGRLWVAETVDYPNDKHPPGEGNDVIRILEDTDGDGRADRSTVFAEGLSIPTGLVFTDGGVIVAEAPDFVFLADTTGDDRADVRRTVVTGWGTRDTHAGPSNLQYGFDNWIWGVLGYSGFEGEVGGESHRFGAGVYRFRPDGSELELVADFTNNTFGLGFSESFDVFGSTANNEHAVHVPIPNRYYEGAPDRLSPGRKKIDGHYALHPIAAHVRQVDSQGGFTSASGFNLYTARSFPREYWNRIAFVGEPTGNLLHRAVLERDGSGFREEDGWNILASRDEWTSPVDARVGPDGAVWMIDFYQFRKQHNTPWPRPPGGMGWETGPGNSYITPLRDRDMGRIYRLSWEDAPEYRPLSLGADRPQELVQTLRHPNLFWRMTAQRLLVERGERDVAPALRRLVEGRGVDEVGLDPGAIHGLWTLHGLGLLDGSDPGTEAVVADALAHPSAGVRRNVLMALPPNGRTLERVLASGVLRDEDPAVRLRAFLALADQPESDAVGRVLYDVSRDTALLGDEWLPTALFLAAMRHGDGFLGAYAEEVGALAFARTAGRAYRGEVGESTDLSGPALDDAEWETVPVPGSWSDTGLDGFTGVVWLRRELELPAAVEGPVTLSFGSVRDEAVVYVNGERVARVEGGDAAVPVPADVLRVGRNVVALRMTNGRGQGGLYGDPGSVWLDAAGARTSLEGPWRYEVEASWEGGRRPDFVRGVPFVEQYLTYRNPVGDPAARAAGERRGPRPDVTFAMGAVPGQNRFTREALTVRPGQRVAIVFDNTDEMPHNVVVLEAGTDVDAVGPGLNAFAARPEAAAADYVPPDFPALAVGSLVLPRESGTLVFTAPDEPGEYPFICTFPGHWLTMRGVLRVEE